MHKVAAVKFPVAEGPMYSDNLLKVGRVSVNYLEKITSIVFNSELGTE